MLREMELLFEQMRINAGLMRDASLAKAREEINAQYTADMRSIDRLIEIANAGGNGHAVTGVTATPQPAKTGRDKIGATAAAREAVSLLPEPFTGADVLNAIAKLHPNAKIATPSIYSAMNKLKSSGEIEVVKKNKGREPGTYRRSSTLHADPKAGE